tara:strand:+ start:9864 stop:13877 length:4014 start_codon:yes stop_codon:yes gene_type:complete
MSNIVKIEDDNKQKNHVDILNEDSDQETSDKGSNIEMSGSGSDTVTLESDSEIEISEKLESENKPKIDIKDEVIGKKNPVLHNLFKNNINNFNFDKSVLVNNEDKLSSKKDAQYFLNAIELLNNKLSDEITNERIENNGKTYMMDYLYPTLDDKNLNNKISSKKEFNEYKFDININENIEEEAEKLCNKDFALAPHQKFIMNFLSEYTPYNGVLLYHGLGTGKTCSAIGIAEESRRYMKYNDIDKQILIVASPNVQINFRLQLFDETKLEYKNNKWIINNCAGQNILDEINALQSKIPKSKVIKLVDNIINNYYSFIGYIELANLINKHSNINNFLKENSKISKKKQNLLIKNKLEKFFGNRLIIIDEIHNIRDTKDNSNKLVAKQVDNLVKNVNNMKLVLMSATPMFNDYKEIVFLLNLLNANDKRSLIEIKDVFNSDGSFVLDEDGNESGKDLLIRKLNGYVSYVKGDNPFIFPYRILPELYDIEKSLKNPNFTYPINNVIGNRLGEDIKITLLDLYLTKLNDYQERAYNFIVSKTEFKDDSDSYKYTLLLKPLESLNIVYPNKELENVSLEEMNSLKIDVKNLVGKSGLSNIMSYEQDTKLGYRFNYKYIDDSAEKVFLRENLIKYSSKISNIINSIENSKGPIIIYSQFIDGGLIPLALALESYGFKRYGNSKSLFEKPPIEELDIYSYKSKTEALKENGKFRSAKYIMITGDKVLSPNKEEELKSCNDPDNVNGENIKVILISSAGSEGLDFKYIRQIHIMEPWYNVNRIEQIIGRGIRTCSHKDLPLTERNVQIFMYASILSNSTIETVDLLIYRKAEEKAKLIGNITRIMKENSIDCHLNYDLNMFNENKFSKLVNNELKIRLSNNNVIKYKIGDKAFSPLCDYMASCEYKCNPEKEEDILQKDEENNFKTFNDMYLETSNNRIIKLIKDLYKENYFYNKEDLIALINLKDNYSLLAINNALDELVNNNLQTITDKYDREGKLVNIESLYIYQPLELDNERTSIYYRSSLGNNILNSITYEVPDIKEKKIKTTDEKKLPNESFKESEKILLEIIHNYNNIIDGNINYVEKKEKSKYNSLAYIMNLNKNNDSIIFNGDLEILKDIILDILIDNLSMQAYVDLFTYIFNNIKAYEENESEYINIVISIKKYFDQSIINIEHNGKKLKGFVFHLPSEYAKYTLLLINQYEKGINITYGENSDYKHSIDTILEKYNVDSELFPNAFAYIDEGKKVDDFYDFKIIHFLHEKKVFSKGRICNNFHRIQDKYDAFMNQFMTKEVYNSLNKKFKLGKHICIVSELYFRYYDIIAKDGKKWFFNMNHAAINDKIKLIKH